MLADNYHFISYKKILFDIKKIIQSVLNIQHLPMSIITHCLTCHRQGLYTQDKATSKPTNAESIPMYVDVCHLYFINFGSDKLSNLCYKVL
jgi:hypothetical protein